MARERGEQRPREERRAASASPERVAPEDFYPTIVDTLGNIRDLVRPLGEGYIAHLNYIVGLVESGTFSAYEFDMTQKGPATVDVHIALQGKGSGPAIHAWAQGNINGEQIRSGGFLVKTPSSGIFWRARSKDEEAIVKEGQEYRDSKQVIGYIQQGKAPRRPIMIPDAQKTFPNGFEVVAFESNNGARVSKTTKDQTVLVRVRKL